MLYNDNGVRSVWSVCLKYRLVWQLEDPLWSQRPEPEAVVAVVAVGMTGGPGVVAGLLVFHAVLRLMDAVVFWAPSQVVSRPM